MRQTHPERTVFFVRLDASGTVHAIARTTSAGLEAVKTSFPHHEVREITEMEHATWRGKRALAVVDGHLVDMAGTDDPASVELVRQIARARLDRAADRVWAGMLPTTIGQLATFFLALREADIAGGGPEDEAAFPMMAAERAARRDLGQELSLADMAGILQDEAAQLAAAAAGIKSACKIAKMRIASATSKVDIVRIVDEVEWPTSGRVS